MHARKWAGANLNLVEISKVYSYCSNYSASLNSCQRLSTRRARPFSALLSGGKGRRRCFTARLLETCPLAKIKFQDASCAHGITQIHARNQLYQQQAAVEWSLSFSTIIALWHEARRRSPCSRIESLSCDFFMDFCNTLKHKHALVLFDILLHILTKVFSPSFYFNT
jgi:hypothetical protein